MCSKCLGPSFYVAFCPRRVAQVLTILPGVFLAQLYFIPPTSFSAQQECSSHAVAYAKSLLCTNNLAHTTAFKLKNVHGPATAQMPRLEWSGRPQQKRRNHYTCLGWMPPAPPPPPPSPRRMSVLTAGPVFLRSDCHRSKAVRMKFSPAGGLMHSCGHRIMSA